MSSIIRFTLADDGAGPAARTPTYGNFDALATLEELEAILTGRDLEDVIATGGPDTTGGDDRPLVLRVPAVVVDALARADSGTVAATARRWLAMRAAEGEHIDEELGHEIVAELAALAVTAARTGRSLHCRIT